jgi:glycosyltransferase involved in cell wall biosynthesis
VSRLLFVVESLAEGGTERSLVELLPGLLAAGHTAEIALLFRRGGLEERARELGVEVVHLAGGGWAGWVRALRRRLRERPPDLVHSMLFRSDLVARLASVGGRHPLLCSLVNTPYEPVRADDSAISPARRRVVRAVDGWTGRRLGDHFHAVSETVKRSAVARLGLPEERITVVPRGRDRGRLGEPGEERRRRARAGLGLDADDRVVLAVGRMEFQKGLRHLVGATPRIAFEGRPPVVLIAGRAGAAGAEISALRHRLGLGDRVRLLGHRDDVPELLAAADVLVSPTLFEGMPGAILEAMAMGLPVVASDLPAVREVAEAEESALLVPPGDEPALAAAISRLLADRPLASRLGRRGRRVFEQRFTIERSIEGHLALYARLLAGGGRPR